MACRVRCPLGKELIVAWAREGIVGRGVLVDYFSWAKENKLEYSILETHSITLDSIKKCIEAQKLTLKAGDVLFIRSGFVNTYSKLDTADREKIASVNPPHFAGVEQSEAVLEWIWDEKFAAVAGDAPSFEAWRTNLPTYSGLMRDSDAGEISST
jgi:Putative cyclase